MLLQWSKRSVVCIEGFTKQLTSSEAQVQRTLPKFCIDISRWSSSRLQEKLQRSVISPSRREAVEVELLLRDLPKADVGKVKEDINNIVTWTNEHLRQNLRSSVLSPQFRDELLAEVRRRIASAEKPTAEPGRRKTEEEEDKKSLASRKQAQRSLQQAELAHARQLHNIRQTRLPMNWKIFRTNLELKKNF